MTAASRGPHLFSIFSNDEVLYQTRREAFVFSLLGQAAILGVIIYFTSCVIRSTPELARQVPKWSERFFPGTMVEAAAITILCPRRTAIFPELRLIRKSHLQP